jgi:TetR/AcrR family transcriptional regulator, regulator of cefoperazone and chloramphenicol sensitivity
MADECRRRSAYNVGIDSMTVQEREQSGPVTAPSIDGRIARVSEDAESGGANDDLTARVRIRDAALKHFAEDGYERTTIRAIARTAGVSHGMLRHHFGSKIDLRAGCDEYVFQVLHRLNTVFLNMPNATVPSLQSSKPLWRYAARTLAEGSPTAAPIFDELVVMTARRLARSEHPSSAQVDDKSHTQATLLAAMASAIPLFQEHLSRALGVDVFSPEGSALITHTLRSMFPSTTDDDPVPSGIFTTRTVEAT